MSVINKHVIYVIRRCMSGTLQRTLHTETMNRRVADFAEILLSARGCTIERTYLPRVRGCKRKA